MSRDMIQSCLLSSVFIAGTTSTTVAWESYPPPLTLSERVFEFDTVAFAEYLGSVDAAQNNNPRKGRYRILHVAKSDVSTEAGRRITDDLKQQPATGIVRGQQFSLLTTRSRTFSKFGFWTQAVALQEAALLLKSNTSKELRLFRNYASLSRHRYQEYSAKRQEAVLRRSEGTADRIDVASLRERIDDDIRNYVVMLTHGERLMHSGTLEYPQLAEIFRIIHLLPNTVDSYERWDEIQEHRRQFFWQAVARLSAHSRGIRQKIVDSEEPLPLMLDHTNPLLQYSNWMQRALSWQLTHGPRVQLPGYAFK